MSFNRGNVTLRCRPEFDREKSYPVDTGETEPHPNGGRRKKLVFLPKSLFTYDEDEGTITGPQWWVEQNGVEHLIED